MLTRRKANFPVEEGSSQSSEDDRAHNETPIIMAKIGEARNVADRLLLFQKDMIKPIIANRLVQPILPFFDPRINYFHEMINWQSCYRLYFTANHNLNAMVDTLRKGLQDIEKRVLQCKWTPKRYSTKKKRRMAVQIDREFRCLYQNCFKSYGSDVSLNLHMKLKHRGGNKTDRQKFALQVCQAEYHQTPLPRSEIVFPPGYLESFRANYLQKSNTELRTQ